jgi:hypothetical protein
MTASMPDDLYQAINAKLAGILSDMEPAFLGSAYTPPPTVTWDDVSRMARTYLSVDYGYPDAPPLVFTTGGTMPVPGPVQMTEYFGVHVDPSDVAATYTAQPDMWTDMIEARPRARCMVSPSAKDDADLRVVVLTDGALLHDEKAVRIDEYPGEKYAQVREEGRARWARLDAVADRG